MKSYELIDELRVRCDIVRSLEQVVQSHKNLTSAGIEIDPQRIKNVEKMILDNNRRIKEIEALLL